MPTVLSTFADIFEQNLKVSTPLLMFTGKCLEVEREKPNFLINLEV